MKKQIKQREPSSFRDPSAYIFYHQGQVYRQINHGYAQDYSTLIKSGLYDLLVKDKLLVTHTEVSRSLSPDKKAFKVIRPQTIPFISYPYEWSFSQLQAAALLTLKIQKLALQQDLSLKDASGYNIQFIGSQPIFIDTTSFEAYKPNSPWVAYRQFCQHFLAPLSLMSYLDLRLGSLLRPHLDGIPLDLTSRLLPVSTRLNFGLLLHLFLHAKSQSGLKSSNKTNSRSTSLTKVSLLNLIEHLSTTISKLKPKDMDTPWQDYYTFTNYAPGSFQKKKQLVTRIITSIKPKVVWDLGSNTGTFTQIAAQCGAYTVAFDSDIRSVEKLYSSLSPKNQFQILPLLTDLTNPSPNLGWAGLERQSLSNRSKPDLILALALIHHLSITGHISFSQIAEYFSNLGKYLLIEFVPKHDSQIIEMLSSRQDIFDWYNQKNFESAFSKHFLTLKTHSIPGTDRTLYLLQTKHVIK